MPPSGNCLVASSIGWHWALSPLGGNEAPGGHEDIVLVPVLQPSND